MCYPLAVSQSRSLCCPIPTPQALLQPCLSSEISVTMSSRLHLLFCRSSLWLTPCSEFLFQVYISTQRFSGVFFFCFCRFDWFLSSLDSYVPLNLFFFSILGFELWAYTLTPWAILPDLFCDGFFQDRVSRTICLDWLWTAVLLISASWVARITGMSHQRPAQFFLLHV
jgi:hypothetical protein